MFKKSQRESTMTYHLMMLSSIPVAWDGSAFKTLDLWAVDLAEQVKFTLSFKLICPVLQKVPADWSGAALVPAGIEIISRDAMTPAILAAAMSVCDVLQVHAGGGWLESRMAMSLMKEARRRNIKTIVGISSNRARTALLNSLNPSSWRAIPAVPRGLMRFVSVSLVYRKLTADADGTFIVGEGLRAVVSARCPSLHVGTASWIQVEDIAAARSSADFLDVRRLKQLCIATRLEKMKGVHVGIEAVNRLCKSGSAGFTLAIFGAGPELAELEQQVKRADLSQTVTFNGVLAYPQPFLGRIRSYGIVLLTNLNEEQPRLIFDAISQGTLPLCPNTRPYAALKLPQPLLYEVGDADSLALTLNNLWQSTPDQLNDYWAQLFAIAEQCTLNAMHRSRAAWIEKDILSLDAAACVAPTARSGNA
jgi:glycosyltransferase involved in cell wall biosynthesis